MCGRYQLNLDASAVAAASSSTWRPGHASRYAPRNEVRPTTYAPVVVRGSETGNEVALMKWSISSIGSYSQTLINARQETLSLKPTFARALKTGGRCVVPSSGFYEWYKPAGGGKLATEPFLIRREKVTLMAGLYERRQTDEGEQLGFVIITTSACGGFEWLHDRQPCFLDSEEEVERWLGGEDAASMLATKNGVKWTRMTGDLSRAAENQKKPRKQVDMRSFFGGGSAKRKDGSKATDGPGAKDVSKAKAASKRKSTAQGKDQGVAKQSQTIRKS